ncbi:MAG: cytochrome P450 [Alphaproteobacteria bacterium]|nr:cytochrome P450 [Alphaproteobacteria bacterium]
MAEARIPSNMMELTPLNPDFQADPHALLGPLRDQCPVMRDDTFGAFIISKYDDVRALVSDRTLWRDPTLAEDASMFGQRIKAERAAAMEGPSGTSILFLDDPDHARVRQPLTQALYARVAKAKPQVEAIVDQRLDALAGEAEFDLMARYCVPIPIDAIAAILGVDRARLDEFRDWSEGIIQGLNPFRTEQQTAHLMRSGEALRAYFQAAMADRRANPKDDLITDMVRLKEEGAALEDEEIRINLTALLVGGNLTTTDLIGNGVRLFLLNPEQLAAFRADPKLAANAVEEILRYEPPVDITGRVASRDMEVRGCPVHKTASMTFSLRAANRDPDVFEDAETFDITRKRAPHIAFGGGAHICIGAPLARIEAQIALTKLFDRFPNLRLADPNAAPTWRTLPFFRGLETLKVAV